ncbi:glutamyl-tRNA reductase [Pontibacter ummariensis]|uniref:Glutamyl-tRNA reductase n=1 Tax=Pontibacter ummariensis TaxID=1610492 RepID=A0A239J4I3_9BACT|nr:glutamyl-tRNA reductase [Pontibacter ummariensis]PRY08876.1 glutamyl-tRNA reductase [Pontibacter ummariensis]SNT00715.1 glutamyl-tRNA reductase [Pontibacter ummariensis]
MNVLQAVSLSHQTAALEWRQALQLSKEEAAAFMVSLKQEGLVDGVMLVTTCNRTEVYYESAGTPTTVIQDALLQFRNIANKATYTALFVSYTQTEATLRYLLEVGLGLRSQVMGDRQIIGQFKESYQRTKDLELGGTLLHQALQTLFRTHKRVHNETSFRSGASSVGYAALERISDFVPRKEFVHKRMLIIGTGQMGTDIAKYATSFGFKDITLTNRTDEKAQALASKLGLQAIPFADYLATIHTYDIIVSCVSAGAQLTAEQLGVPMQENRRVLLDLSVPLSISPDTGALPYTTLVNIDHISSKTEAVKKAREESITDVQCIVEEETKGFTNWLEDLPVAKTIGNLKSFFAAVLESELQKHTNLQDGDTVKKLAKATLDRLIRRPAGTLRTTEGAPRQVLMDSLNQLFQIA